ncbi:MAG TPA: hypothetical protein VHB77_17035 [Planctomycetaceae bacterium]|nr:hypothetical protein [Planctomycetaceae bacterium]
MSHVTNGRTSVVGQGLERVEDRNLLSASLGGTVNVSIVGNAVTISGDAHEDHIVVQQTPGGAMQIIGGTNTRLSAGAGLAVSGNSVFIPAADNVTTLNVNFGDSLSTIAFCNMALPDNINISAGNGNDKVLIAGCTGSSNVSISMGTGIDQLAIYGSSLGSLSSTMGSDSSTNADRVEVRGTTVSGDATIKTGGGNDSVMLASAPHNGGDGFTGNVNVFLGAGNDYFSANNSTFSGDLNVNMGLGNNIAVGLVSVAGGINVTGNGVNLIHRGL